ncbi:SAM-dependent methyltransferase [Dyella koreensis]|uniref:DOT1 domain-containing protein n=1 Tax=Dyella koreensis TaxID=311235 RepID=A0ABW8K2J1_9GAMM
MSFTLKTLIETMEKNPALAGADRLRQRLDMLDELDACLMRAGDASGPADVALRHRAEAIRTQWEALNAACYDFMRDEIRQGVAPSGLLRWMKDAAFEPGDAYDFRDELLSGVLAFDEPDAGIAELPSEMVFYQPTPARHIVDMIERTGLGDGDVLVDLGSGLGHVPLLAAICTGARCIGIELEQAYVQAAQRCAQTLHLGRVRFVQQDARVADVSEGTVFYLYTPFVGSVLSTVLDTLRQEASARDIRICTFGPCTATVAKQSWLKAVDPLKPGRIAVFRAS